ncbi:MAG: hypothetical protein ABL308_06540 [Oceanicaulis sp.]
MSVRYLAAGLAGLAAAACATTETPIACRDASAAERAAFGAIVAHDEARVAQMTTDPALSRRIADLDPAVAAQVFGQRMGDRSVRTVLMQPPLCVYDAPQSDTERLAYVFPSGRFERLQNDALPGAELGMAAVDHAACRFVNQGGQWTLADACLATFAPPPAPAS